MKKFIQKALLKHGYEINKIHCLDDSDLYYKFFDNESIQKRKFYNISAGGHFEFGGKFFHPLWTNVDVDKKWVNGKNFNSNRDLKFDPMSLQKLPIETNSAELIYSRLTVEHITDEAAQNLFCEVYRILKPGGIARFLCPHSDLYYRAYKRNDRDFYYWAKDHSFMVNASIEQLFLDHFAASCTTLRTEGSPKRFTDEEFREIINKYTYEEALDYIKSHCSIDFHYSNRRNHINWWNFNKFNRMFTIAGFKETFLSNPWQSHSPVMRNEYYFDNLYNKIVIYVEVIKT
ncbi:MAG: methyltransferase domain-containing protein [Bacteroidales bacterium]|nr:methyltransferase domain-containing protein [Bacteroidales bacterium]